MRTLCTLPPWQHRIKTCSVPSPGNRRRPGVAFLFGEPQRLASLRAAPPGLPDLLPPLRLSPSRAGAPRESRIASTRSRDWSVCTLAAHTSAALRGIGRFSRSFKNRPSRIAHNARSRCDWDHYTPVKSKINGHLPPPSPARSQATCLQTAVRIEATAESLQAVSIASAHGLVFPCVRIPVKSATDSGIVSDSESDLIPDSFRSVATLVFSVDFLYSQVSGIRQENGRFLAGRSSRFMGRRSASPPSSLYPI